jgi:uncharacterized tellurite resistance protein B-like protein
VKHREQKAVFEALLAVTGADGRITRAERGLLEALAERVGVGRLSLNAMIEQALRERESAGTSSLHSVEDPLAALELLVAAARIDGAVSETERHLLVRIAEVWGVPNDAFVEVFKRGLAAADRRRAARRDGAPPDAGR